MKRAYYSNPIQKFLYDSNSGILGELAKHYTLNNLKDLQINAWNDQILILKKQLQCFKNIKGKIYFEFAIPRMGKKVDNILILHDTIFVIEFKVGDKRYEKYAIDQVIDYTLDLKNFHEGSHHTKLIPVLVATNANKIYEPIENVNSFDQAAKANQENLANVIIEFIDWTKEPIDIDAWENSIYKPTPTIIEAAQALYKGHNVKEITRSEAGAINLSKTAECINLIIETSKLYKQKSICFVTGVPGAGKTLAGLNITVERMKSDKDEHAVFLSGNGPLVNVLREALIRDEVATQKEMEERINRKEITKKAYTFIQNIHFFRDDNLKYDRAPIEKVVVFDEAQRAWTKEKLTDFMKRKRGVKDFNMSEPEFLIKVMDRHIDWCTIVCLIGGGQEINTGEAGLEEWIIALRNHFKNWKIYFSHLILRSENYINSFYIKDWLRDNGYIKNELHLAVSVRSFRAERLSEFIYELLNIQEDRAKEIYQKIKEDYPIVLTRNLEIAKTWLRKQAKGSEKIGLISSSGARRLRPFGIDVKNEIFAPYWFLNDKMDIRSSYFLEEVATEFDIQGLEIDWACIAWGANFYMYKNSWNYQKFRGTKWMNINKEEDREYLKNTYRVLLTRARQGMVIFIPEGSKSDHTRPSKFYDDTYNYLKRIGIKEI